MNIEKLKNVYFKISLSEKEVNEGWADLQSRMQIQKTPFSFRQRFIFISLLLFFGLTLATITAASPSSLLYPVRVLSDKVISQITKKPEIKIERRIDDVVSSTKDSKSLNEASKQYEKTLDEVKKDMGSEAGASGIQNEALEKAEEKLNKAAKENPGVKDKLDPIIDKTKEVKSKLQKENKKN